LFLATSIALSARPTGFSAATQKERTRDIMLCLDVSGSMIEVDSQLFSVFNDLVDNLKGERIGLIAFDASAVTLVPLTDDYSLLKDYFKSGENSFKKLVETKDVMAFSEAEFKDFERIRAGTGEGPGSSMIGTGFAACVNHMGSNTDTRTRSIILVTDNEASDQDIIKTPAAASFAKAQKVRVYSITPGATKSEAFEGPSAQSLRELELAVRQTDGESYTTDNLSVEQIVNNITKQEVKSADVATSAVQKDSPEIFIYGCWILLCSLLIISWRYKL
jgi:uncharacterized protein with von Willebrand factor type A (vWA) domain